MNLMPFLVTHDMKFCDEESETYRFLIWAESPVDAARGLHASKKEQELPLPDVYHVHPLRRGGHWELHELGDGSYPERDRQDLDMYEEMFGEGKEVRL